MATNITEEIQYIFTDRYADDAVSHDITKDHPLLDGIMKKGGFNAKGQFYSLKLANTQGVSADFDAAQASITTTQGVQPYITRFRRFGIIRLNGEDMLAAPDRGALYDYVTEQTDSIFEEMGNDFALDLYGDSSGLRGQISSHAGQVITLANAADVRHFGIGMTIVADDNASGLSPRAGSTTVTAINESGGTITVANFAAANMVDGDYLFRYGDGGVCVQGLGLCTPLTAPVFGSDSFRTIDRGTYVDKLAGVRLTGSGALLEDIGLLAVKSKQGVRSRMFKEFYLNPINFHAAVQTTGAKIEYSGGGGEAVAGFESIVVSTEGGMVRLKSDPDCATTIGYGVNPAEHWIWHLGEFPHVIKDSGSPKMTVYNADSIEIRARAFWNYLQKMPGAFGVLSIV